MADNYRIIPAPIKGINLAVPEQRLDPEMAYARDVVNMLPTDRDTLRKRPGFGYFSSVSEEIVPLEIFEFGSITETGLTPVMVWVGHQGIYIVSKIIFFPDNFNILGSGYATTGAAITIGWEQAADATGYEIEYKFATDTDWEVPHEGGGIIKIGRGTQVSQIITGLVRDTLYDFRMRSVRDIEGDITYSTWAPPVQGETVSTPLIPSNLRGTAGARKAAGQTTDITTRWNVVTYPGETITYDVRYKKGNDSWTEITGITGTSRKISNLAQNTRWEFQVQAKVGVNKSGYSSSIFVTTGTALAAPSPIPTGGAVARDGIGILVFSWDATIRAATYEVRWREKGKNWSAYITGITATSRRFPDLKDGTEYEFQVRARNEGGVSNPSGTASGFTKLAKPTIASATKTLTTLTPSWDAITGRTTYTLRHRERGTSAWTEITGITATSRQITGQTSGKEYEVQVQAVRGTNLSDWSISFFVRLGIGVGAFSSLTVTKRAVALAWGAIAGAADYDIQYREDGTADAWTLIEDITGRTRSVTGLDPSTTYEFQLRGKTTAGDSATAADWSSSSTATTDDLVLPGVPGGLAGTPGVTATTMRWDEDEDASTYELEYRRGSGAWTAITGIKVTNHRVTGLNSETAYQWRVRSRNDDGPSGYSDVVTITTLRQARPPGVPSGLGLTPGAEKLTVAWTKGSLADFTELRYRRTVTPTPSWTVITGITGTSQELKGLIGKQEYEVQVRSRNNDGTSTWTTSRTATAGIGAGAFSSLTGTKRAVALAWGAIVGAADYDIRFRRDGSEGDWELVEDLTRRTRTILGLGPGITYEFQLRGKTTAGDASTAGPWSSSSTATTDSLVLPGVPGGLAGTPAATATTMRWKTSSNALSFELEYRRGNGAWTAITGIEGTSRRVTGLSSSTSYQWRVRARNNDGPSGYSDVVSITTLALVAPDPVTITRSQTWKWPWTHFSKAKIEVRGGNGSSGSSGSSGTSFGGARSGGTTATTGSSGSSGGSSSVVYDGDTYSASGGSGGSGGRGSQTVIIFGVSFAGPFGGFYFEISRSTTPGRAPTSGSPGSTKTYNLTGISLNDEFKITIGRGGGAKVVITPIA